MKKFQFLSSFFIKVAAIVFMTFDHVGLILQMAFPWKGEIVLLANIFRSLGRLALPLFVFMIVEGVMHTKSIKKYFLRLGIVAFLISLFIALITYIDFGIDTTGLANQGNIFLDLLLLAVCIYLLKQDKLWMKFLTLLPLGISIASFVVKCYEFSTGADVLWYPSFLFLQYDWFSVGLGILFYLSYKLMDLYIKYAEEKSGIDTSIWSIEGNYRLGVSIIQIFMLIAISVFFYLFIYIWPDGVYWDHTTQLIAIASSALILLYNGKRGYNAKWFQIGAYIYYPLHLAIIMLIYALFL